MGVKSAKSSTPCCPAKGGGSNSFPRSQCAEIDDANRTLLGQEQKTWLDGVLRSDARWTVLAQQTLISPAAQGVGPDRVIWTDGWDGYPAERSWLTRTLAKRKAQNPIVVGGDIHAAVVGNLHHDPEDADTAVVASEFCSTSVTSAGDDRYKPDVLPKDNPGVQYANFAQRGYTLLELTRDRCDVRLRAVDEKDPKSKVETSATFAVEAGRAGTQRA